MRRSTLALGEFEWDAEPTDGVSLSGGGAWWGLAVKYRRIGNRPWHRFTIVAPGFHSWDTDKIEEAIRAHVRLNGTRR